jgi:hypothetical protein
MLQAWQTAVLECLTYDHSDIFVKRARRAASPCAAGAAEHGAARRASRRPWQRGRSAAGVGARGGAPVRPGRGARRPPLRAASPWQHAGSDMALWPKVGVPMQMQSQPELR